MDKPRFPVVLAAIVLLLLPVLYVGSYLALVVPQGHWIIVKVGLNGVHGSREHYRFNAHRIKPLYWPLEQLDRKVRTRERNRIGLERQISESGPLPRSRKWP